MNAILQNRIEEAAKTLINYNLVDLGDLVNQHDLRRMLIGMGVKTLQNQWISVDEDLPPYDKAVIGMDYMPELAWDDQTIIFVHRSDNPNVVTDKNKFCVYPPRFCKVTHWMEIPSLEGGEG